MKTLRTRWTDQILKHPEQVLQEYPRPTLVRDSYVNLNGYWDYAITTSENLPKNYDGKILVPFSPESLLSGVCRQLQPSEYLWYRIILPKEITYHPGKRWILHFGAIDQSATICLNGVVLFRHTGGYLPFSVDITDGLFCGMNDENEIIVRVQDLSDTSYHSRGKQKLNSGGMYYTAQSGIWQTVWAEEVPENHIENIKVITSKDNTHVSIVVLSSTTLGILGKIKDPRSGKVIPFEGMSNQNIEIQLADMKTWSPEDPFLYGLEIEMERDRVTSYFAVREVCVQKDEKGIHRVFLNGKPYFQKGLLDQGYWPDGLYTAPTDEAMIFDISEVKRLGFNMLRKHCKIEPERWYYHCDRLGMLVWQDIVNGGDPYQDWYVTYLATALSHTPIKPKDHTYRLLSRNSSIQRKMYTEEMVETIRKLFQHPCIVTWTLFNEGWGQFDAASITEIARKEDDTRLIDHASGWFDQGVGDYQSIHEYFLPLKFKNDHRVTALTEFGGYSYHVPLHSACDKEYGYKKFDSIESLSQGYEMLIKKEILPNISKGLSATIYTQVSDIEEETNGIYTYDRELLKIKEEILMKYNKEMTL